jgi:hypothetical protein
MADHTTLLAPAAARARVIAEPRPAPPRPPRLDLSAKAIKLTLVVDPTALAGFTVPEGGGKVRFRVQAGGRNLAGELNPKTVRRVIASVAVLDKYRDTLIPDLRLLPPFEAPGRA